MIPKIGAALMGLGVAAGAFGAHALKSVLPPDLMEVYRTAVLYQLIHGAALIGLASVKKDLRLVPALLTAGVVVFSGSLYLLALTGVHLWGAVTPLGGLLLIGGWTLLLFQKISD